MQNGTEVQVSGHRHSPTTGRAVPYGFRGTVVGTHEPTGRPVVRTWQHDRYVVREDEVVTDVSPRNAGAIVGTASNGQSVVIATVYRD